MFQGNYQILYRTIDYLNRQVRTNLMHNRGSVLGFHLSLGKGDRKSDSARWKTRGKGSVYNLDSVVLILVVVVVGVSIVQMWECKIPFLWLQNLFPEGNLQVSADKCGLQILIPGNQTMVWNICRPQCNHIWQTCTDSHTCKWTHTFSDRSDRERSPLTL